MPRIAILGIFAADCGFRADRLPEHGETLIGREFTLGPGGKGSNQAVAAARAGGQVDFLTRLGRDTFASLARETWAEAGVTPHVIESDSATGAAFIYLEEGTGENAIIVAPGAAGEISAADIEAWADTIRAADIFVVQLEQPMEAALEGLTVARDAGVRTILNPAPAAELPAEMLALCDIVTPNESEAALLTGRKVSDRAEAEAAARDILAKGAGHVVMTLGAEGALIVGEDGVTHVAGRLAGPVRATVGAGDCFNGALAVALSEGRDIAEAAAFANAAAALSVTRDGAAASMPRRAEIDALLSGD